MRSRLSSLLAGAVAVATTAGLLAVSPASARPAEPTAAQAAPTTLTNLTHLDFLTDTVTVTPSAAHTTYQLPAAGGDIGVLWVYADRNSDGSYRRVGGGAYNAADNTWGQGAFDTDDIARAAVVYLRAWQQTGSAHAREQALQQLRGLAYFQTLTGPNAGEIVLWMQPDGTLNPTPTPADSPNPADSGPSYWLARSLWAFGEGYAAFRDSDPAFAAFLKSRMDLAVTALHRDVLGDYGSYLSIHGIRVPAWLIVDGADASSEAMLGLSAYVAAGGSDAARSALQQLGDAVAAMSAGSRTQWPYRALLPWALSQSDWHAWGAQMPSGLAAASTALHQRQLLAPAIDDAAGFSAQLLTATGPDNGWLPTPTDRVQIAYGADARVQGLLAVGTASGRQGITDLAGVAAGWFFGANRSGRPVYNPATGVTFDGIEADGRVNANSGAESTIHGLLTMLALDAHPRLAALARHSATIGIRDGLTVVEAESGTLAGGASVQTPASAWTGESLWSGAYVAAPAGSTVTWTLPAADQPRLVQPSVELTPGSSAVSVFASGGRPLGTVRYGNVGAQGDAPSPTMLLPVDLGRTLPAAATTVSATTSAGTGAIDALLVMPVVATLTASGDGGSVAVLTSKSGRSEQRTVTLPGAGQATASVYSSDGIQIGRPQQTAAGAVTVRIPPGGFAVVTRG